MPVPQQLVIDRIRVRCEEVEERYPGYRAELVGYLADILGLERASPPDLGRQVATRLQNFGDLYHRRLSSDDAS